MRGTNGTSGSLFRHVDPEERIPAHRPLRKIRQVVDNALARLDTDFSAVCGDFARPSIAPERLIRASLIQILFSIRSERQLIGQMHDNLLFRWLVGPGVDDPARAVTVFTRNRDRLLNTGMSRKVMAAILAHREVAPLLPDDRFPADGALVKAWASMKSFRPKTGGARGDDGPGDPPSLDTAADDRPALTGIDPMPDTGPGPRNAEVGFRGKKRSNAAYASTTDPEARLYKKAPGTGPRCASSLTP